MSYVVSALYLPLKCMSCPCHPYHIGFYIFRSKAKPLAIVACASHGRVESKQGPDEEVHHRCTAVGSWYGVLPWFGTFLREWVPQLASMETAVSVKGHGMSASLACKMQLCT